MTPQPRDGDSPFLPGTCIQFAWDSTCLEALKRCPRKYQLEMIEGWRPKADRVHLTFGIHYTNALEMYDRLKANEDFPFIHDLAVKAVVSATLEATWIWDECPECFGSGIVNPGVFKCSDCDGTGEVGPGHPWEYGAWDSKIGNKNRFTLIRSIIWYLDQYRDDPAVTVIDEDGKPMVERSFRLELDWGPHYIPHNPTATELADPNFQLEGVKYILCGHLDRVVNYLGGTFVMDHKTTKNAIGDYYFDQYNPHGQMTGYTLAGKIILKSPIKGVIIDAVQVLVTDSRFARGFTYRTEAQLEEWLVDLRYWTSQAEGFATAGYWPMNDASCFNCPFNKGDSKICAKDPAVRSAFLQSHFTQEDPWNPLKPRN